MIRVSGAFPCIAAAVFVIIAGQGQGAWIENGTLLGAQTGDFYSPAVAVLSDGTGGAVVAWADARSVSHLDLYAQRLDGHGRELWTAGGLAVCAAAGTQCSPALAADGAGGTLIVWQDYRNGNADIYAQRLGSGGAALWTANGVAVSTSTSYEEWPRIVPDGLGGAFVAYARNEGGYDVWTAHLSSTGALLGHQRLALSGENSYPAAAPDGRGGVYVVWRDSRNGNYDIFGQRLDRDFTAWWAAGGDTVCAGTGGQEVPQIVADGFGCAIVVWPDTRNSTSDIYAQKVNRAGSLLWASSGLQVTGPSSQTAPLLCGDGAGGVLVTWRDDRPGVYAQRISGAGTALWTANGALVATATDYPYPRIEADGAGGAIVAWHGAPLAGNNVYAQRMSATGTALGPTEGVALCNLIGDQQEPALASDGAGGAIMAWNDYRNQELGGSYPQVYAQRFERNLFWGYPSPTIDRLRDVPGDQGGRLYLDWSASRLDAWPDLLIERYTIWKAVDAATALRALAAGSAVAAESAAGELASALPVIRREEVGATVHYWELVAEMAANGYPRYSKTVATDFDSTAAGFVLTHFQVCAHGATASAAWTSLPDSGYSVDNLPPAAPVGLAGVQSYDPLGLDLSWRPNAEADLAGYRVYRGTSEGFTPAPGNLIASPADTSLMDAGASWSEGWWFKVAAVDVHGNQSGFAVLGPGDLTGAPLPAAPALTRLEPNRPNPFNPRTAIGFSLARPGPVRLEIYAPDGHLVRLLVDGLRAAGRHEVVWDGRDRHGREVGSGVYLCRLKAYESVQGRKLVLLR